MKEGRKWSATGDVIHEDVVDAVTKKLPDERELYDLSYFFKVLGDSTRVKIMWALDEKRRCGVCDLAVLLGHDEFRRLPSASLAVGSRTS